MRIELNYVLYRQVPPTVMVVGEPQFNLSDRLFRVPDILLHPKSIKTPDVRAPTALVVIEVADTSLPTDLRVKAATYALYGVSEYWVIGAWSLETKVHRQPTDRRTFRAA